MMSKLPLTSVDSICATFRHVAELALGLILSVGCIPSDNGSQQEHTTIEAAVEHTEKRAKPHDAPQQSNTVRFRVATYNINFGNPNLAAVIETIKRADADVVCLQETNSRSAHALARALSKQYPHIRFNGTVKPYRAGGFGVLSRLPIIDERFIPSQHGLFGIHTFAIVVGDRPVDIYSIHLRPVSMPRVKGVRILTEALTAFSKTEETHELEIEWLLQHVGRARPALIVGDFNSLSTGAAPTTLGEKGFSDSFATVNDNPNNHPTWHWQTAFGEYALRIDYIFHSASLQTTESRVIESPGSDHHLLVSQLELGH